MEKKKNQMPSETVNEEVVELKEEDLENVAGGRAGYFSCPECGNELKRYVSLDGSGTICPNCGYYITYDWIKNLKSV